MFPYPKSYITTVHYKRFYYFPPPCPNFCQLFTISQNLALTFVNWSDLTYFSNPCVKIKKNKKKFLTLTENYNLTQLILFLALSFYARTLSCIVENSPQCGNFFYPFVTEHHSLNPRFNSSICCQLLLLSIRPHLVINSLYVYLF